MGYKAYLSSDNRKTRKGDRRKVYDHNKAETPRKIRRDKVEAVKKFAADENEKLVKYRQDLAEKAEAKKKAALQAQAVDASAQAPVVPA